jgi:hypothetical protein
MIQEAFLKEIIECPSCSKQFDEFDALPLVLECGETCCSSCLTTHLKKHTEKSNTFKCVKCANTHELPKHSTFPTNLLILKLAELFEKRKRINETSKTRKQSQVYGIDRKSSTANLSVISGEISDKINQLKSEIEEDFRSTLGIINTYFSALLDELKSYESELIASHQRLSAYKENLDFDLHNELNEKWHEHLDNLSLNRKEVVNSFELTSMLDKLLKTKKSDFHAQLFDSIAKNSLESSKQSRRRCLRKADIKLKEVKNFVELKSFDLRKYLADRHPIIYRMKFEILENGHYVIAYFNSKMDVFFAILDGDKQLIKQFNDDSMKINLYFMKLFRFKNRIMLYSYFKELFVQVYDENMNKKLQISMSVPIISAVANDDNIFILTRKNHICTYDWEGNLMRENTEFEPNIPKVVTQFDVFHDVYIFKHEEGVVVLDSHDGSVISKFEAYGHRFLLNANETLLIILNNQTKIISYFDFYGKRLYEKQIKDHPGELGLLFNMSKEEMVFADFERSIIYT